MTVVENEDFVQQEAIQRNVGTGIYEQRIFGRNEPALIHYHEGLDRALGSSTVFQSATRSTSSAVSGVSN